MEKNDGKLIVGLAQLAPVWLDKKTTLKKIIVAIHHQHKENIGFSKAKKLIPDMRSKGWIFQEKGKGPYQLGQYE